MLRRQAAALLLAALFMPGLASAQTPRGSAFGVNQIHRDDQLRPQAAAMPDGGFVAVWISRATPKGFFQARYRLFAADGAPRTPELTVGGGGGNDGFPAVATAPDGGFAIVWETGNDSTRRSLGRLFDAAGQPLGDPFPLSDVSGGSSFIPAVDVAADGTLVTAWAQGTTQGGLSQVYARRFEADGSPLAPAFRVDDAAGVGRVDEPRVAALPGGGFVAGWLGYAASAPVPSGGDLYLRRFGADGSPAGPGARLNERTVGSTAPLYGMDVSEDGRLVVVWPEFDGIPSPAGGLGLFGRLFGPDGTPAGPRFRVDRPGIRFPESSSVRFTKGGGFFVTWRGSTSSQPSSNGIYGRRFAADGSPRGIEIEIARPARRVSLSQPALALNEDGQGAVLWIDQRFDAEIYARRLLQAAP